MRRSMQERKKEGRKGRKEKGCKGREEMRKGK
jgi:hypothetical protein